MIRWFYHVIARLKASSSGIRLPSSVMLSLSSGYSLHHTASVSFADGVRFAAHHQVLVGKNSIIKIGRNVHLGQRVKLLADLGGSITVGDDCSFNDDVSIIALNQIYIGQNSIFGPYTYICDHNHGTSRQELIRSQGYDTSAIIIGSDVWLGVGATLLKGSTVGNGAVVAARAVVNTAVPDFEIWGGIPAKKLGERF